MQPLKNPNHERFAQSIANLETAQNAYLKAYPGTTKEAARRSGSRLLTNVDVQRRIDDIQRQSGQEHGATRKSIAEKLMKIAAKAEADGKPNGLNVARNAYMDVAKLYGFLVERTDNNHTHYTITDTPQNEHEWEAEHTDNMGPSSGTTESVS